MRASVIINVRAGAALGLEPPELARRLGQAFAEAGSEADVRTVAPQDLAGELEAAMKRDRPIIVGGGDGTVRTAAARLIRTSIPLGILPMGTMNLLARDLAIPLAMEEAALALARGTALDIDVASVNGDIFLCNSLLGLPAVVAGARAELRGKGVVHGLQAGMALARRIATLRHRIAVELDDGQQARSLRVMALSVSNNSYANASPLGLMRPRLDGGTLAVYTSRHRTGLSAAFAIVRAYFGDWRGDPYISEQHAQSLSIRSRRRTLVLSNDGEVRSYETPLRYHCHPRALSVIVPQPVAVEQAEGHDARSTDTPDALACRQP